MKTTFFILHPSAFILFFRHAPKDLNPDQLGWSQPCCRLHQRRVLSFFVQRKRPIRHPCRSVPDSNSQAACAATCFQDRSLIQPDDFHSCFKLRELESNQRPPGSEPGVTTSSNYSGMRLFHWLSLLRYRPRPASGLIGRRARLLYQQRLPRSGRFSDGTGHPEVRGEGFEPPPPGSKPSRRAGMLGG